ncbi:MAG: D-glycero-beta-D-manno-heptose 1-phosphate adenylyltransferase [Pseudomonadota bacterium]
MHQPRKLSSKIKSLNELKPVVEELKRQGTQVVFTNGCFDIIHSGHVKLLQEAREAGGVLIVGLNSDSSVKALKGPARPIVSQEQRAQVVAALEAVDYVVIFYELDPLQMIEALVPSVLIKGGDWTPETIIGRDVVEQAGGKVFAIPLKDGASSTDIVLRIQERLQYTPVLPAGDL